VQVFPAQHQIGLRRLLLLSSAVARHHTARGTALGPGGSLCVRVWCTRTSVRLWLCTWGIATADDPAPDCLCTCPQLSCMANFWVPVHSLCCARETHYLN